MTKPKPKRCPVSGKYMYPTREAALDGAIGSVKARHVDLRIYECPDCNALHLTRRLKPVTTTVPTVPRPFTPNDLALIIARRKSA